MNIVFIVIIDMEICKENLLQNKSGLETIMLERSLK